MRRSIVALIGWMFMLGGAVADAAPVIQAFESDSLAHIVAGQRGRPFVLIIWSLDCEYCQTSLAALAQTTRVRKDLRVVTLSTDAMGDKQAANLMRKKLASLGMTNHAWAFGSAPAEQLRYVIDSKWHGEMPRSYWFNADGEKVAYSGALTPAMIDKLSPPLAAK